VIVVVGEALVDLVIDPSGGVAASLGGAPVNTARACGRLGAAVAYAGALSNDRFGNLLAAQLAADRVSLELVERSDLPTTLAAAELDERGAATYRFYVDGTSAPSFTNAATADAAHEPAVLFTGGLALLLEPLAVTVEQMLSAVPSESTVMIDLNCRPRIVGDRERYLDRIDRVLARADVVKASDEDLAYLAPEIPTSEVARTLLARGARAVLITAGGSSVEVHTATGDVAVPVPDVPVVDTIGAGDSFSGAFLAWWAEAARSRSALGSLDAIVPAVEAAIEVAGIVCTRRGADPPWRQELNPDWGP
jgi:fructokinase